MSARVVTPRRRPSLPNALVVAALVAVALMPVPTAATSTTTPPPPDGPSRDETELRRLRLESERRRALRAYGTALGVSVLVACAVVLAAIDHQSALVPDTEGHGWAFSTLFGPGQWGLHRQGWTVLSTGGIADMERFDSLLRAHVGVDLVFLATYGWLLVRLVLALGRRRRWRTAGLALVGLLLASDVLEDVLALRAGRHPGVIGTLMWTTEIKWGLVALVAVVVAARLVLPRPVRAPAPPNAGTGVRRSLRRAVTAVVHQRFSYVPVLAIFVLSVPSGSPILEQLPDAQRQWIFDAGTGRQHAVAAIAATALLGLFLLAVGRERTVYALRHHRGPDGRDEAPPADPGPARFAVWLVGPVLALIGILLVRHERHTPLILTARTSVWVAVPLLVILLSLGIALVWWLHERWYHPYVAPTFDHGEAFAVGIGGTAAAAAAVVVGGLSLLRALTPLVVLPPRVYADANTTADWHDGLVALLVTAAVAVLGPWVALLALTARFGGPSRRVVVAADGTAIERRGLGRRLLEQPLLGRAFAGRAWLLLAVATLVFLGLGCFPVAAAAVGLSATATLALGSLAGMLAGVGLVLQERPTAEVFRLLRLRRTPLVSLLALTVVLVNALGSSGTLHEVDPGTSTEVAARPAIDTAFTTWVHGPGSCSLTVAGRPVKPMIMVAAQGGGIRATYWTVLGLEAMDDQTCAASSTFFSGGASGGSVGLTVARFSGSGGAPDAAAARTAVESMARPETLSQAADGTFVRDLVYGATGIPVPRLEEPDPFRWLDRARLIENGWSDSGPWGRRHFLEQTDVSPATGALVLNSTSVTGSCRVWLSQLQLPAPPESRSATFDPELTCDKVTGVAPRTIDLFAAYGPLQQTDDRRCLGSVSTPTAALLTARFPYVTPSGVVCPRDVVDRRLATRPFWPRTQLVDGGYIDNTGLATVTDLAPVWLPLVRAQNATALADRTRQEPLVVPVVVYLANGDRDTSQPARGAAPVSELAVPAVTYLASQTALSNEEAQLARARQVVTLDAFCPSTRTVVCRNLDAALPARVVVVDRATQPEVAAPLGWVMSEASLTSLRSDMAAQRRTRCEANQPSGLTADDGPEVPPTEAACRPGFATLGDLRRYLTGGGG